MRKSLFFKIAGQLICILATALFLFPLVLMPVSYTHLDVYKRQHQDRREGQQVENPYIY